MEFNKCAVYISKYLYHNISEITNSFHESYAGSMQENVKYPRTFHFGTFEATKTNCHKHDTLLCMNLHQTF